MPSTRRAGARWRGAATIGGVAALFSALGCALPPQMGSDPGAHARAAALRSALDAGLDLYGSGEFVLAARRFAYAADQAERLGDREIERRAVAGECTAWLRARKLAELSACSQRLEALQRRAPRADPGVNTLIALGAIAAERPLPPLRLPDAAKPLIRETVKESQR